MPGLGADEGWLSPPPICGHFRQVWPLGPASPGRVRTSCSALARRSGLQTHLSSPHQSTNEEPCPQQAR